MIKYYIWIVLGTQILLSLLTQTLYCKPRVEIIAMTLQESQEEEYWSDYYYPTKEALEQHIKNHPIYGEQEHDFSPSTYTRVVYSKTVSEPTIYEQMNGITDNNTGFSNNTSQELSDTVSTESSSGREKDASSNTNSAKADIEKTAVPQKNECTYDFDSDDTLRGLYSESDHILQGLYAKPSSSSATTWATLEQMFGGNSSNNNNTGLSDSSDTESSSSSDESTNPININYINSVITEYKMLVDGIKDVLKIGEVGLAFVNTKFPNLTEDQGADLLNAVLNTEHNTTEDSQILLHLIVSVTTTVYLNQEQIVDPEVQLAYYSVNFENLLETHKQS